MIGLSSDVQVNKMFTKIPNRKIAASILLLAFVIFLALGYFFRRQSPETIVCVIADLIYLVPEDIAQIEDLVKPEKFLAIQEPYSVEFTSDWGCVNLLASERQAQAVIIHHAATEGVNLEELQHLFKQERFIVADIGIPDKKLAEMVGMPGLTRDADIYKTSAYYYIFSFWVEGTLDPEDMAKLETVEDIPELLTNELPGSGGVRTSTDSLLTSEDSIHRMLRVIGDHLYGVNQ